MDTSRTARRTHPAGGGAGRHGKAQRMSSRWVSYARPDSIRSHMAVSRPAAHTCRYESRCRARGSNLSYARPSGVALRSRLRELAGTGQAPHGPRRNPPRERISRRAATAPIVRHHPEHSAYVIFTSARPANHGRHRHQRLGARHFAEPRDRGLPAARARLGSPLSIVHACR